MFKRFIGVESLVAKHRRGGRKVKGGGDWQPAAKLRKIELQMIVKLTKPGFGVVVASDGAVD